MLASEEIWGMNGFGSATEEFISLVESFELQDLPLLGSNYTLFEGKPGCARSKLHRFLIRDFDFGWSFVGLFNKRFSSLHRITCQSYCL